MDPEITDTNTKEASSAVTQVVPIETDKITENHLPEDMNDKDMVEAVWIFNKSRTTPCAPCAWQIIKQWIMLSTVRIGDIILVQD